MNEQWEHLADIGKVAGLNTIALITSFQGDLEWWIRITGLILAAFYTLLKIYAHFFPRRKDKDEA